MDITKYYVDSDGKYIGGYAGNHGKDVSEYTEVPIPPPKRYLKWDVVAKDYIIDNLPLYKQDRLEEINIKNDLLSALGFAHDNGNGIKQFPIVDDNKIDLYKEVLPLTLSTIDGMDEETFTTEAEIDSFFLSASNTKVLHKESGKVFEISILNASNKADVDAVIDNR